MATQPSPAAPPSSDESRRRRVDPLAQRNIQYRLHHILVCELKDRRRGGFEGLPCAGGDLTPDRSLRSLAVDGHRTAEKMLRIDVP